MKIASLRITEDGPINFGFDFGNETNISVDVMHKLKRAPNVAWLQEIEGVNQRSRVENVKLRRLLQESDKEKQRMQHQLQAKEEALETLRHNKPEVKSDSSISCTFYDDDFISFEKHTIGIGSKLLKRMG